jgi:hypothetical protein
MRTLIFYIVLAILPIGWAIFTAGGCARLFKKDSAESPEYLDAGIESEQVSQLRVELAECNKQIETVRETVKVKTRTRVVEGKPKRCGGSGPVVLPVPSTQCLPKMVCLDERAQAALAANLLSYEKWVRDVQACENK